MQLLLDADQLTMMSMVDGIDVSDNGQAMDALRETVQASTPWLSPYTSQLRDSLLALITGR